MLYSEYDTVVCAVSGQPEIRRVMAVEEWRIEKEMDSDCVVISFIAANGMAQSFLINLADSQDISEVLLMKTRLQQLHG